MPRVPACAPEAVRGPHWTEIRHSHVGCHDQLARRRHRPQSRLVDADLGHTRDILTHPALSVTNDIHGAAHKRIVDQIQQLCGNLGRFRPRTTQRDCGVGDARGDRVDARHGFARQDRTVYQWERRVCAPHEPW